MNGGGIIGAQQCSIPRFTKNKQHVRHSKWPQGKPWTPISWDKAKLKIREFLLYFYPLAFADEEFLSCYSSQLLIFSLNLEKDFESNLSLIKVQEA